MSIVNMPNMNETELLILDATISAVSQYGMRRTSMNDIAERAGVSRQTVYNSFGNKDDIYREAILHMGNLWEAKARQKLERASNLSEQLDAIFEVFAMDAFKFSHSNKKDAEDMFEDAEIIAQDALKSFHAIARGLYEELFQPFTKTIQRKGMTAEILAEQVETACRSYKKEARSLNHLKDLLRVQKALLLSVLEVG